MKTEDVIKHVSVMLTSDEIDISNYLVSNLEPCDLTFVAEHLGAEFSNKATKTLISLLEHNSPAVREGAILGLRFNITEEVDSILTKISKTDNSYAVRDIALSVIENK